MTKDTRTSNVMRQIDENLKRVYQDAAGGDVPDRFKDLLSRLKNQDQEHDKRGNDTNDHAANE
ncbi:NepR family anti-sigma factor [Palleronia sediminis]|nr:NepR family anti-sigma factor [Palleronia sediminis]